MGGEYSRAKSSNSNPRDDEIKTRDLPPKHLNAKIIHLQYGANLYLME
jgi:hypothetical protein